MQGHLIERRPGVWLVRISGPLDPVSGKRTQPSRTVHGSRDDAELELARLVVAKGRGTLAPTKATVTFLFDEWFAHATGRLSPTTLRGYRKLATQRILPRFGTWKLRDLTTADLDRFYDGLLASGLNPRTIRNIHSVIRRAYTHAIRWGWVTVNPATNAQPPSIIVPKRQMLTADQIRAAIDTAKILEPEFAVFLRLAYATGARRGELCALRWTDLAWSDRMLSISRSVASVDGGTLEKSTKTERERDVMLDFGTIDELRAHCKLMVERANLAGKEMADDAFIFSARLDCSVPWHPDAVTHRWSEVRDVGRLPLWARLHDVRHAHASMLIDSGVPIATVSERLGHASQTITLGVYNHPFRARDAEAAAVIGAVLDSPGGINDP